MHGGLKSSRSGSFPACYSLAVAVSMTVSKVEQLCNNGAEVTNQMSTAKASSGGEG